MIDTRYTDTYRVAIEDIKKNVLTATDKNINDLKREAYLNCIMDALDFLDRCIKTDLLDDQHKIESLQMQLIAERTRHN